MPPVRSISATLASRRTCRSAPLNVARGTPRRSPRPARSDHAAAQTEHVHVIVLDCLVGGVGVVHGGGADAEDLAGGDRHAGAGAADDDPALGLAGDDRLPDRERLVGVVDRLRRSVPRSRTSCPAPRSAPAALAQRYAGVVESAGNDHPLTSVVESEPVGQRRARRAGSSSCSASNAAPSTPARTPCRASRIVVLPPRPGSTYRGRPAWRARAAGRPPERRRRRSRPPRDRTC